MTVVLGIKCKDGVVIGADSSATLGQAPNLRTIEQKVNKITVIGDRVIVAGTGEVGLGQRFNAVVQTAWQDRNKPFNKSPIEVGKHLASCAIKDYQSTHLKNINFGALVAFPTSGKAHLCEFAVGNFQPEQKTDESLWYASMGSGQPITDPFLGFMRRVFWKDDLPASQDGIFAVTWALQHAIEINPGGINGPMQIAVLGPGKNGQLFAKVLEESELAEHKDNVEGAISHLRKYRQQLSDDKPPSLPAKP
ncbi:MAG: hypothetical protein OXN16_17775 [Gammaproteobacteria bacterium]|nr:hypothetical protein [Gammaproteobacteria bacterium]